MSERQLIVDHLKFSYEGLMNVGEIYNLISGWFFEKGWDWHEKMNEEQITPEGKQIRIVLEPWKSSSDYYKLQVKIKLNFIDIKEVEVDKKGEKLKLDHGVLRMIIDGYVISDRFSKWGGSPFSWFMSIIIEKYFFKHHYKKLQQWLENDIDDLHQKVKGYLNVYSYTYQ